MIWLLVGCGTSHQLSPEDFIGTWELGAGAKRISSCETPVDLTGERFQLKVSKTADLIMSGQCRVHDQVHDHG